jgi:tetratricopeptide (TPR) repeat protein
MQGSHRMADANNSSPTPEPPPGNEPPASEAVQEQPAAPAAPPVGDFDLSTLPIVSTEKAQEGKRPGMSPERFAQEAKRFDRVLVFLVLVLGFFLASFTARNSDVWLHLATGRALAQGQYVFGTDPFSSTTAGVYWANHSWLYDWATFGFVQLWGGMPAAGPALVVAKALLVALLAGFMLAIRRRGQSAWVPAVCVALGLLVMSPRLLLQPVVMSFLFLGITLWVLAREGKKERTPEMRGWRVLFTSSPARLNVLPVLFLLWVNLDAWFFLGPLAVGLYLLGEIADRAMERQDEPSAIRPLIVIGILGTAACLINPHHYHAFVLPPESFPAVFLAPLKDDPLFQGLFVAPFTSGYSSNAIGGNAAGIAYFVLLGLSLFSFGLQLGFLRGWRVAVWLPLAVWSMLNIRGVPFFAVAAGPIAALNLQDFAVRCFGAGLPESRGGQRWGLLGRFATVLGLAALLALAWPGWLQTNSSDPVLARRVTWNVEVNPSWKKLTEHIAAWRAQGWLQEGACGFNVSPDAANYCAWFCPEEKGFFDYRYALFPEATADFLAVRRALLGSQTREDQPTYDRTVWRRVFPRRSVNHIILAGVPDRTVTAMMLSEREWTLLYLDGRAMVFAWRDDPLRPPPVPSLVRHDMSTRAFGAGPPTGGLSRDGAPGEGPGRGPQRPDFWQRYLHAPPPRPLDADEAAMLIELYYRPMAQLRQEAFATRYMAWNSSTIAGLPGWATTDSIGSSVSIAERLMLTNWFFSMVMGPVDLGPPAAPLVALRAARRALASNPDDSRGYAALARCADALWRLENHWTGQPPPAQRLQLPFLRQFRQVLTQRRQPIEPYLSPWIKRSLTPRQLVRQVELVWAWQQALALGQDSRPCHESLYSIFWQMGYYDRALEHFRQFVQAFKSGGAGNEDPRRFEQQVKNLENDLKGFEDEMEKLRTEYELASANLPANARAGVALIFGLSKQAIPVLEKIEGKSLSFEDADLLIYLYLTTGQLGKLNEGGRLGTLDENLRQPLRELYDRDQALLAAATGDYALAAQALDRLLAQPSKPMVPLAVRFLQFLTVENLQAPSLAGLAFLDPQLANATRQVQGELFRLLGKERERREWLTLRGIIALEQGDTEAARKHFALAVRPGVSFESRTIAERYLELLEGKEGGGKGK